MKNLVIYGGTFCPIHWGHLRVAQCVQAHLQCDEVFFLPCKAPVLEKGTHVSVTHRVAMLQRVLALFPQFSLDLTEINRDTPSYMVDTLLDFRERYGFEAAIHLLLGMDSFLDLPRWSRWDSLLSLANIVVVERAGVPFKMNEELERVYLSHHTESRDELQAHAFGKIYRFDAGEYDISSSLVRKMLARGEVTENVIPAVVQEYIHSHCLFKAN